MVTFLVQRQMVRIHGNDAARYEGLGLALDPQILPSVLKTRRVSLQSGMPFEIEFPLRGADGIYRWFLTRVHPVRDVNGQVVLWFGTNTDVHHQRVLLLSLSEARDNLETRIAERTELVWDTASIPVQWNPVQ